MQFGGSDYLAKPFGADDLRRKVVALLTARSESEAG
jgi:DNA-binding response OmpR family regulator